MVPMEWDCPAPARSPSVLQFRIENKQNICKLITLKNLHLSLRAHLTSWGRMISDFPFSVLMYFPSLGKKITFYLFLFLFLRTGADLFLFLFLFLRAGAPFFVYDVPHSECDNLCQIMRLYNPTTSAVIGYSSVYLIGQFISVQH